MVRGRHRGHRPDRCDGGGAGPDAGAEDSPLGRALLGHRVGESVSYEAPEGRATAEVVSLGEQPEG
ncbi:GreA/GreB family elongation factor [Streptomyces sp. NPDC101171]|uniref:GreA/GreB family elongation factor n=1 Tax=Streptomyces sp. NPDC101171 TaxID=3366122 RepID=UPI0038178294